MKNVTTCELTIEDKTFVNDKKETIEYVSVVANLDGEEIHLSVKKEDKSLLRALRRNMKEAL